MKIERQITQRDGISLDKYLTEIGRFPLLTPEEEISLAVDIRKGDHKALEKLVNGNLRFVVSVAKQYQNNGLSLGDLINEGNLGLIKAAQRFDETRGFKFISYAVWWIRQSILQSLAEQSRIVRLPLNRVGAINKISKYYNQLLQEFEREPTPEEISKVVDMTADEIRETLRNASRQIYIDSPFGTDSENKSLYDILEDNSQPKPDSGLMSDSMKSEIESVLNTLADREREVIKLYYGIGVEHSMTLEEIGEKFNLTRERVRQIKEKALRRLRTISRSKRLKDFLG